LMTRGGTGTHEDTAIDRVSVDISVVTWTSRYCQAHTSTRESDF
jgi:hypothetical protein